MEHTQPDYVYAAAGDRSLPLRPPPFFIRKMVAYDRELVVGFNAGEGSYAPYGRWIIGRKRRDGTIAMVMTVQTPDGGYRPLGLHVIDTLKKIDSWRIGKKEQARQLEMVWEQQSRDRMKRTLNVFREKTDKLLWAMRKDFDQYSTAHISKQDSIDHERKVEQQSQRVILATS